MRASCTMWASPPPYRRIPDRSTGDRRGSSGTRHTAGTRRAFPRSTWRSRRGRTAAPRYCPRACRPRPTAASRPRRSDAASGGASTATTRCCSSCSTPRRLSGPGSAQASSQLGQVGKVPNRGCCRCQGTVSGFSVCRPEHAHPPSRSRCVRGSAALAVPGRPACSGG